MLQGTLCPNCGKPVMPYSRFLREAEPYKTSRCSNCQVELKRNWKVWLLLLVSGIILMAVTLAGVMYILPRWGVVGVAIACVIAIVVFTFVVNVCGWLFVRWDLAKPASQSPSA